jgi:hypothetical protein
MTIRKVLGTSLLVVGITSAAYGTASAAPAFIDTGSASGSSQAESGTPCNDGWVSPSHGSGTCSHHGGEKGNPHVHHGDGRGHGHSHRR